MKAAKDKERGQAKTAKVTIDENYFFVIDGRQMVLHRNGANDPIGYYCSWADMLHRIVYMNSLDLANEKKNVTIREYIEIIRAETARIVRLFEGITNP
jgi:hypothetical protein